MQKGFNIKIYNCSNKPNKCHAQKGGCNPLYKVNLLFFRKFFGYVFFQQVFNRNAKKFCNVRQRLHTWGYFCVFPSRHSVIRIIEFACKFPLGHVVLFSKVSNVLCHNFFNVFHKSPTKKCITNSKEYQTKSKYIFF